MSRHAERSQTRSPAGRGAVSAWPLLAGLHLSLLLFLIGTAVALLPPRIPSFSARLQALDVAQATAAVSQARAAADGGRALSPEDEARALQFLTLLGQSAELDVLGSRLRPGVARDGVQPIDVALTLAGDPYHLPIFLDGLYHQREINHPLSVQGSGAGTHAEFSVIVRYYRPLPVDASWVPGRLAAAVPDPTTTTAHAALLQEALVLAAWRCFRQEERALSQRASAVRREVARTISPALIQLRRAGGAVSWRYADPLAPPTTLN